VKLKHLHEDVSDVQIVIHTIYEYLSERTGRPREVPLYPSKPDIEGTGNATLNVYSPEGWLITTFVVKDGTFVYARGPWGSRVPGGHFNLADPNSLEEMRELCYNIYNGKKKRSYGRTRLRPRQGTP